MKYESNWPGWLVLIIAQQKNPQSEVDIVQPDFHPDNREIDPSNAMCCNEVISFIAAFEPCYLVYFGKKQRNTAKQCATTRWLFCTAFAQHLAGDWSWCIPERPIYFSERPRECENAKEAKRI